MTPWASVPWWWVEPHLRSFTAGSAAGTNMAALRVYLALGLRAQYGTWTASESWSRIEELSGLSRPMVQRGLERLEASPLLTINRDQHPHRYTLVSDSHDKGFLKLPTRRLYASLPKLPRRGNHALDCLKLYITLLRVRARNGHTATISHGAIVDWTGIKPNRVRAAIDVLANHSLVHVLKVQSLETGHMYNEYQLIGFPGVTKPEAKQLQLS